MFLILKEAWPTRLLCWKQSQAAGVSAARLGLQVTDTPSNPKDISQQDTSTQRPTSMLLPLSSWYQHLSGHGITVGLLQLLASQHSLSLQAHRRTGGTMAQGGISLLTCTRSEVFCVFLHVRSPEEGGKSQSVTGCMLWSPLAPQVPPHSHNSPGAGDKEGL